MYNKAGAVCSLQTINPDGNKLFLKGISVTGLCCSIGISIDTAKTVCLAEGWATGSAIHAATGYPVAVAFSTSNLSHVAKIIRAKHPGSTIIVCADDDRKADSKKNPGIEAAITAAESVAGLLAIPDMGKKADFWGLWHEQGPEAIQGCP
jgi:putative DNA primase/helicase